MSMQYFDKINDSLKELSILISKSIIIKFNLEESETVEKEILELMCMVRAMENSEIMESLTKEERYYAGKTIGRLEAIYSILFPKRVNNEK